MSKVRSVEMGFDFSCASWLEILGWWVAQEILMAYKSKFYFSFRFCDLNQLSIILESLKVDSLRILTLEPKIVKRLGLGLGTWDLGLGTWDLGNGKWEMGNGKWE